MYHMKKQIEFSDILKYVYHETSPEENFLIEQELFHHEDNAIEMFYELIQMKKDLDHLQLVPSEHIVSNIMNYAHLKNKGLKSQDTEQQYV